MATRSLPLAAAVLLVGLLAAAQGIPAISLPGGLPDLTVDHQRMQPFLTTINYPANDCVVQEGMAPPGPQKVVRFATSLPNVGLGDLVLGNPPQEPGRFVWAECHRHYHVVEYADYRVWQPEDYLQYAVLRAQDPSSPAADVLAKLAPDAQPVRATKHARCVIDLLQVSPVAEAPRYRSCSNQGITVGWADHYNSGVVGQWVVVDGVPSGDYLVEIEVNAGRLYEELEYWNNSVVAPFRIP